MDVPESIFHPSVAGRRGADGPVFDTLLGYLRGKCDEHVTPGAGEYVDHQQRQAEFWTARLGCRFLPRALEHLAFGGILLDGRYTDAARAIVRTIIEHRIAENARTIHKVTGEVSLGWRHGVLDAGASSVALAIVFDLLRQAMPAEECSRFAEYLLPFVEYLLANPPDVQERKPEHNIASTANVGMGLLALSLRSAGMLDEGRFQTALERSKHRAKLLLGKFAEAEGAFLEGPSYSSSALEYVALFAFALGRCGDREVIEHPAWGLAAEGLTYELIGGTGRINPLNDCGEVAALGWLAQAAAAGPSGLAQWLWRKLTNLEGPFQPEPADHRWRSIITRYILYYDPAVEPTAPAEAGLPLARHFPVRDLVDIRTGWEADDTLLSFLCDAGPRGGHRQADRNHFTFHALGESFAIDSAYGHERMPNGLVLKMGHGGEAHNLPLVHGEMAHEIPSATDGLRRVELDGPIKFVQGEAGGSYLSAERFTRRAAFLPPDGDFRGAVVIADLLTFGKLGPTKLAWLLHTDAANELEIDADTVTLIGGRCGSRCVVRIVTPAHGRWRRDVYLGHPRVIYEWFYQPLICLAVLAPYRAGEAPPEIAAEKTATACVLRIGTGRGAHTAIVSLPGRATAIGGVETDAEFALVGEGDGEPAEQVISAGTFVRTT